MSVASVPPNTPFPFAGAYRVHDAVPQPATRRPLLAAPHALHLRSRPRAVAWGLTLLASAACGGDSTGPRPNTGGAFPKQAAPVTVTVALDEGHAASTLIPVSGGAVSATGADGSRFTLTIPANALLQPTTITLTPVTSVSGMPLSGGLVAAAHFEPEGLRLYEVATLRIEPARAVPTGEQVGFGYYGTGADFHLAPLAMGAAIELPVQHFSGVGVGQGTAADQGAQLARAPAATEAQLQQEIGALVGAERAAELSGQPGDADFGSNLAALMQDYFDNVVEPKLEAAENSNDPAVIQEALNTALAWERMAQLLGMETDALQRTLALVIKLAEINFNDAYTRCLQNPLQAAMHLERMLAAARIAALLGLEDDPRFAFSKIDECARANLPPRMRLTFEATFVSENDFLGAGAITYTSTARASVLVDRMTGTSVYQGSAPITYSAYTINSSANTEVEQTSLGTTDGVWAGMVIVNPDGTIKITKGLDAESGGVRPRERFSQTGRGGNHALDIASAESNYWGNGWDQLFAALGANATLPTGLAIGAQGVFASTISRADLNPGGSPHVVQADVSFTLNPNP